MSRVYMARDLRLGKTWAVKELLPGEDSRFFEKSLMAEANLMKSLDNPYLPRIVDIIRENNLVYIVMDYVEGEPLSSYVRRNGPLRGTAAGSLMMQLCYALSYLHSKSPPIIYRDLKPSNVMLTPEGNIKLIDFGVAARPGRVQGEITGTAGYAAPEQYRGESSIAADIYSLGATMYYVVTGKRPLKAGTPYSLPDEKITAVIGKCMAADPGERYGSCKEIIRELSGKKGMGSLLSKKRLAMLGISLCLLVAVCSITRGIVKPYADKARYEELISIESGLSPDDIYDRSVEAVKLCPDRPEGYELMLKSYEEKGGFTKKEGTRYLTVYKRYGRDLEGRKAETVKLRLLAGRSFLTGYREGEEVSLGEKISNALVFLGANHEAAEEAGDLEGMELSECYYRICMFCKTYILSRVDVKEAPKDEYESLLEDLMEIIDKTKGEDEYERLTFMSWAYALVFDQREAFAAKKVEEEKVMGLFARIVEEAEGLEVGRKESVTLRGEILKSKEEYKELIRRAYGERK